MIKGIIKILDGVFDVLTALLAGLFWLVIGTIVIVIAIMFIASDGDGPKSNRNTTPATTADDSNEPLLPPQDGTEERIE